MTLVTCYKRKNKIIWAADRMASDGHSSIDLHMKKFKTVGSAGIGVCGCLSVCQVLMCSPDLEELLSLLPKDPETYDKFVHNDLIPVIWELICVHAAGLDRPLNTFAFDILLSLGDTKYTIDAHKCWIRTDKPYMSIGSGIEYSEGWLQRGMKGGDLVASKQNTDEMFKFIASRVVSVGEMVDYEEIKL